MATYGFKQRGSSRQATYRSPTTDKQREDSAKLREKRLIASGHKQEEDRLIKEASLHLIISKAMSKFL